MSGERLILTLFAQLALILALIRLMGWILSRLRQPQLVGELIGAVILGPSLLGWVAPQTYQYLFPSQSLPILGVLAQIAGVFFLFIVGLELGPFLGGNSRKFISLGGVLAPLILGLVSFLFLSRVEALFVAAALTVSSFPFLGRIIGQRNLRESPVGMLAIASAALSDVICWCLVLAVILIARHSLHTAIAAGIYLAAMLLVIRPLLKRLQLIYEQRGKLGHNLLAANLLLLLLSSLATQWIGLHAFVGAFFLAVIMPRNPKFVRHLSEKIQDLALVLLLPVLLAYIGLSTDVRAINWAFAVVILAVACLGKIGGAMVAGAQPWRESAAVGILLNSRGLMLLLILLVGRELNLISASVFAAMAVVAVITTGITTPLLNWIYRARSLTAAATGKAGEFSVLIPISLPKSGGPLVQIADSLIGSSDRAGKLFALHLRRWADHETFRSDEEESQAALTPLLAQAKARAISVEPITFMSNDIPADIAQVAAQRHVELVLMGYHNPIFGKAMLGGTVHRVLSTCPAHVAVFVDRGLRNIDRILVPYLGSAHDALSLELAARIVRNSGAQATVLHVVPPLSPSAAKSAEAKRTAERIFETQAAPGTSPNFQVVEDSSPVGVVLHWARNFDLVIIGVAEEWGLESRLFGWRPEKIARDCPASLLIVRKFAKTELAPAKDDLQQPAPTQAPRVAL